jgi:hypothetical protein
VDLDQRTRPLCAVRRGVAPAPATSGDACLTGLWPAPTPQQRPGGAERRRSHLGRERVASRSGAVAGARRVPRRRRGQRAPGPVQRPAPSVRGAGRTGSLLSRARRG